MNSGNTKPMIVIAIGATALAADGSSPEINTLENLSGKIEVYDTGNSELDYIYLDRGGFINELIGYVTNQPESVDQLKDEFDQLMNDYLAETDLVSSIHEMMLNPAYAKIVGFGSKALPWIFSHLSDNPNTIFPILAAIGRTSPVKEHHQGVVEAMIEDWMDWGRARSLC